MRISGLTIRKAGDSDDINEDAGIRVLSRDDVVEPSSLTNNEVGIILGRERATAC